jgi:DNA replication protein DnaC
MWSVISKSLAPPSSDGHNFTFLISRQIGYLTYDSHAADLLFEVINHRYERNSILVTTNKGFKEWNTVFPNATSIAALLDRLTHHAEVTLLEGTSYRS